jgi:hypothetical protein
VAGAAGQGAVLSAAYSRLWGRARELGARPVRAWGSWPQRRQRRRRRQHRRWRRGRGGVCGRPPAAPPGSLSSLAGTRAPHSPPQRQISLPYPPAAGLPCARIRRTARRGRRVRGGACGGSVNGCLSLAIVWSAPDGRAGGGCMRMRPCSRHALAQPGVCAAARRRCMLRCAQRSRMCSRRCCDTGGTPAG